MSIDMIALWHKRARPKPTEQDFNVQLGCHFEEIAEMLETLMGNSPAADELISRMYDATEELANSLKVRELSVEIWPTKREAFLDSLADQIVTSVGVGHCANMHTADAVRRVNSSNWSKTVDGEFVRDVNGKITKGPNYREPDLTGLY